MIKLGLFLLIKFPSLLSSSFICALKRIIVSVILVVLPLPVPPTIKE